MIKKILKEFRKTFKILFVITVLQLGGGVLVFAIGSIFSEILGIDFFDFSNKAMLIIFILLYFACMAFVAKYVVRLHKDF